MGRIRFKISNAKRFYYVIQGQPAMATQGREGPLQAATTKTDPDDLSDKAQGTRTLLKVNCGLYQHKLVTAESSYRAATLIWDTTSLDQAHNRTRLFLCMAGYKTIAPRTGCSVPYVQNTPQQMQNKRDARKEHLE